MSDSATIETVLRQPTIIQTVKAEIVTVRALPAPGVPGPTGSSAVSISIDGGSPSASYTSDAINLDGGTP